MPVDATQRYRFTGSATKGYFSYADLDGTGMLVAEPGQDYAIRALEPQFPVPPSDGQWEPVPAGDPVAPRAAKATKADAGAPAEGTEGSGQ